MSTTLLSLAVDEIGAHPKNVRRDDTPDAELIASVESQGILQPLVVVPAPEDAPARYWLIMGHRRLAAAQAARLMEVPAIVREDLDGEAEQIEAMLVENGRRQDLTAVEEADAYQQLTLLGIDVDEISKTTGRSSTTVRSRLKIAGMATIAKEALHTRQITLEQAEHLAELEEDHELHALAFAAIGTSDFRWKISNLTMQLTRRKEWAASIEEWKAEGLQEVEPPHSWNQQTGPCPLNWLRDADLPRVKSWAYYVAANGWPTKFALELSPAEDVAETDEERETREQREREQAAHEARRKATEERRERHDAARTVREESIRDALYNVRLPKAVTEIFRAVMPVALRRLEAQDVLVGSCGLEHEGNLWSIGAGEVAAWLARKPAHELLAILAIVFAEDLESQSDVANLTPSDTYDRPVLDGQLAYLDALKSTKHPWSEPDAEWRAAIVDRLDDAEEV